MAASNDSPPFPFVVCLGGSAGGLEALEAFFRALPAKCGVPFVVVVHLSPDFKSLMPELLAKHTTMPVQAAREDSVLEPDRVFIIPAGKNMALSGTKLQLETQDRRPGHALNLPIDLFLESLAREFGPRSLSIILSGTGSDGSRGVRAIKEVGGVVFAQDTSSAKFDGMPRSALMTGLVDKAGDPKWLAERVAFLANKQSPHIFTQDEEDPEAQVEEPDERLDTDETDSILLLLRQVIQLDLSYLRRTMIERRIQRRMGIQGITNLSDYTKLLATEPHELSQLGRDLLIGVTRFFRDEFAFDVLRNKIVPELLLATAPYQPLRIWVTACSSGNEVYSLVILFLEAMRASGVERELKVFATDVDEEALERASRGVYTMSEALDIPRHLLSRYFDQHGNEFVVRSQLRDRIIFARHNLVTDPPFSKLHFVSCRNLLIYLEPTARRRVHDSLVASLVPERGILFLGAAETPILPENMLVCIDSRAKIYRRTSFVARPNTNRTVMSDAVGGLRTVSHFRPSNSNSGNRTAEVLLRHVLEVSFENDARSAALIDQNNRLVEILTDPLSVFRFPKGKPSDDLSRICSSGLMAAVSTGQQQIRNGQTAADFLAEGSAPDGADLHVSVALLNPEPARQTVETQNLVLLVLRAVERASPEGLTTIKPDSPERIVALETELRQTKESLQATIEELQSSSEEQQSTNEELIASNEELQSTNQELLSVNEELYTVNSEYHKKNQELQQLTADLDNLLNSTDVATLYLDGELRVRKFTASISRVLPLQGSDHGRPIADLANRLDTDFVPDIKQVLESQRPLEREVRDRGKAWVLMRVSPYKGPNAKGDGVLATFVDVTRIKNAEETARVMSERLIYSNRQLTAQSEQLEDLFSIVAHDLKRPIVGLDGSLKMLNSALNGHNKEARAYVESALKACYSLSLMLKDLSDVSKLRQLDPAIEMVDLNPWLRQVLAPFVKKAKEQDVHLGWASDHGEYKFARAAADAIVTNFVENALVHGTGHPEPRIDVTVQVDNGRVRLSVADNGQGIAPEHHERIFELFRRLRPLDDGGTGVGLVAARRFAERADGHIRVESDVGKGATFIAELPVLEAETDQPKFIPKPILLVDDDAIDAKRVKILLERYPVRWARTLKEGVEEVESRRFGLIIIDLSLPDGHGLTLTSSLTGMNRNTPIIILSGQLEGLMPSALDAAHISAAFSKDEIEAPVFRRAVEIALTG